AEVGRWLMSRPVAMSSNLHNVLFCPEDGVMWVANASHDAPAAERPYVMVDLRALLARMAEHRAQVTTSAP
ncbi:MAG: peptidase C45 acyl-coenzyme A:6-aminopenicillanic acid acyl-transferase, partial [Planctomycetales bacterium]|nr:peptidase C45 acyl-coenzyme A:6-aminopenicillanic acid acyl-transferase [Planctomycetales bacterium]